MTLLEKIDLVLKVLYEESGHNPTLPYIQGLLKDKEIDVGEIRDCIQKLNKDGFVRYEYEGNFVDFYDDYAHFLISFDGKFFYETYGGYENKKTTDDSYTSRLASLEVSRHEQGQTLNRLTGWIVFGTLAGAVAGLIAALYYLSQLFQRH